jgi:hypothetical protein
MKLPRVKPGEVVAAELFNALIDAANGCGITVGPGSGLVLSSNQQGSVLSTAIPMFYWAKTTGPISGGKYPFTQQRPATGGTWTAGSLTGNAYEVNGNTNVATGTYIKIWRAPSGVWLFNASAC